MQETSYSFLPERRSKRAPELRRKRRTWRSDQIDQVAACIVRNADQEASRLVRNGELVQGYLRRDRQVRSTVDKAAR